jgi:hypothetical protein
VRADEIETGGFSAARFSRIDLPAVLNALQ